MKTPHLTLICLLLTGCTSTGEAPPLSPVVQELRAAVEASVDTDFTIPEAVADALLPDFGMVPEAYEPGAERFDIEVNDLEVHEFYRSLVKDTPYNVIVHPELQGVISFDLKNVSLDEVMRLVRDIYGFEYKRRGNLFQVYPGGMKTRIFKVNYLSINRRGESEIRVSAGQVTNAGPSGGGQDDSGRNRVSDDRGTEVVGTRIATTSESNFWSQLGATLQLIVGTGEGRSVVTAPEAGVVVVRGLPSELRTVEEYLRKAELALQRQVVLEAKILEVELNDGYSQGINWSHLDTSSKLSADGTPEKTLLTGQSGQSIINPGLEGVFSAAFRIHDFEALIQLLGTQGKVHVLSSPRIATVNNQKAVIKVGRDEFFVTEISVNENNSDNNTDRTNTDVELTPFFSGIALDVTPQISDDGRIILHVHPSISEVSDQTKVLSLGDRDLILPLALSTIRETDSIISAVSGQVVVIGGLISESYQDDVARVPGLGRLPLLGHAFSQKKRRVQKRELVILIKPVVATPESFHNDLKETEQRFSQLGGWW